MGSSATPDPLFKCSNIRAAPASVADTALQKFARAREIVLPTSKGERTLRWSMRVTRKITTIEKFGKTRETSGDVVALKIVVEVGKSLQVSDGGNHQEFVANY